MEALRKPSGEQPNNKIKWSVLDGEFIPSPDFPNPDEIQVIKGRSAIHPDEEIQRRVFYTELLVYALRYVNPSLINQIVPEKIVIKSLIDEMAGAMYQSGERYRKENVKKIAQEDIDEPIGSPSEIPVMQALHVMQEKGAIDYETRTILDSVVRAVHIKQSGGQV